MIQHMCCLLLVLQENQKVLKLQEKDCQILFWELQTLQFQCQKKIISLTSFTFDIFFLETILALSQGLTVILASEDERKNPKKIEELILNNNVDMMQITPSMMELLYIYNRDLKFVNSLSEIMLGGEKLPQHMLEILQGTGNVKIYNMYGPTETTIWSTVADLTTEDYVHIGNLLKIQKFILWMKI